MGLALPSTDLQAHATWGLASEAVSQEQQEEAQVSKPQGGSGNLRQAFSPWGSVNYSGGWSVSVT